MTPESEKHQETLQETKDPANRPARLISREIRLQETIKRNIASIETAIINADKADQSRPWVIIGMMAEALSSVRDDLDAHL